MMTKEKWQKLRKDEQTEYDKAKLDFEGIHRRNMFSAVINTAIAAVTGLVAICSFRADRYNKGLECGMDIIYKNWKDNLAKLEDELFTKDEPKE